MGQKKTMAEDVTRCSRCVLPVDPKITRGYLTAGPDGLCNFCRAYDRRWSRFDPEESRKALDRLVEKARKKGGQYDALIPISGGKDSLAVLDYMATEYKGLRILAVTLDNGLLAEHAERNCEVVTRRLKVDHLMWRPAHIVTLAKLFLERSGHFCCPCQVALMNMYHVLSVRFGIPIVVLGSSRRLDGAHPEAANPWTPPFFDNVIKGVPGEAELRKDVCEEGLIFKFGLRLFLGQVRIVLLPDYVLWNVEENKKRLQERYGIELREEHSDCLGHPVADWLYKQRCGFGQVAASLAADVRAGLMRREEALLRLREIDEFGMEFPEKAASAFLERLGMSAEEVVACSKVRPDPYFGGTFRVTSLARKVLGLSIA